MTVAELTMSLWGDEEESDYMKQQPGISKHQDFHFLSSNFLLSHGPLGLSLSVSLSFSKVTTGYPFLFFTQNFNSLLNFSVKGTSSS